MDCMDGMDKMDCMDENFEFPAKLNQNLFPG